MHERHDEDDRRAKALLQLGLLNPEPEPFFENLLELIQDVCHAPIAVVSLSDKDRQWFKARRGLSVHELPRRDSLCWNVVRTGQALALNDIAESEQYRDNLLASGPMAIRAYAGAPITLADGLRIGTLCVLDRRPRDWTALEVAHLQRAAQMVANHAEARAAYAELAASHSQMQARQAFLERERLMIDAMTEGVVVHDATGAIIDSNPAASEVLGLTRDQLHGRTSMDPGWAAKDGAGAPITGDNHPAMITLRTGVPQRGALMQVARPDGTYRYLVVNAARLPVEGDDGVQVLATFTDVTAFKAQAELLQDLLSAAHEANQVKTEFLAAMSHEIRTPLNGLLGVAQTLQKRSSDPALTSLVDLLTKAGLALKEIVDDALDLNSIEAGAVRLREAPFHPLELLAEAVALYAPQADAQGIGLNLSADFAETLVVTGDGGRLRQIILNLLSNAIRHTHEGCVSVEASLLPAEQRSSERMLEVLVADTGTGIGPDEQRTLFNGIFRTARDGNTAGAGIGLHLSWKLARAMGGELAYVGGRAAGAAFKVTIPVTCSDELHVSSSSAAAELAPRLRILVAEDHPANRDILSLLLEPFSADIRFVGDGVAAVDAAMKGDLDLVLMDQQMPTMNGIDATRALRAWEERNAAVRLPVIFVSANGNRATIDAARAAGANGYVTKPIVLATLVAEIQRVMADEARPTE